MALIEWTDEARKRAQPRRLEDLPPETPLDPVREWAHLRKEGLRRAAATAGIAEPLAKVADAIEARFLSEEPASELDRDAIAVWLRLCPPNGPSRLASYLLHTHGLPRTVEGWMRTAEIVLQRSGHQQELVVAPDPSAGPIPLVPLREALLRADEATYRACRALVLPHFERFELNAKAGVVRAFPSESEWANAVAREYLATPTHRAVYLLMTALHAATGMDLELLREATLRAGPSYGDLESLLAGYAERGIPIAIELAGTAKQQHDLERVVRALAIVRSAEVAALIASHIGKKKVRKHASEYFLRFGELADDALGPIAQGKTRAAAMAAEMLAQRARALDAASSDVLEAPPEALPTVLVSPPWDGGARAKRKPIVVKAPPSLSGPVAYHGATTSSQSWTTFAPMEPGQVVAWETALDAYERLTHRGPQPSLFVDHASQRAVPPDARLRAFNEGRFRAWLPPGTINDLLAELGVEAIAGVLRWARDALPNASGPWSLSVLASLETPELAPDMAQAMKRRALRELASSWLRRYPEAAIAGLLPAAVGDKDARRTECERALRWLATQGHEARIRERAPELGERGAEAIEEILGWDPIGDCPKKPPKLSARYRPEALVRPMTKDGLALPLSAVQRLGEMLAFSSPDAPYAGLETVHETCDSRSLAEHAWSLALAWEASGARKTDQWMMLSLVHLADDELVRRTTPALKNALVVDVLAHIGSDAAAMELATVAARGAASGGAYSGMREQAEGALDRIALAQGIDRDRLDERLTPTLGLDAAGGLTLDYGPRAFRVSFDEHLDPVVVDDDGGRSRQLPRTRKTDDPEKVARARAMWDELREDIGAIALFRIGALEQAMLAEHEWSAPDFETYWAHHRLMLHLARRVVFCVGPVTFRVAEDGTYADVNDEPLVLGEDALVRVAHPLRWPDATLARWIDVFADYEIIQPFPQLGRPRPRVTPEERAEATIKRVRETAEDTTSARRRLVRCGWRVVNHQLVLAVNDELSAILEHRTQWRSGKDPLYETWLTLRRGADPVPWTEVSEEVLVDALDQVGAL